MQTKSPCYNKSIYVQMYVYFARRRTNGCSLVFGTSSGSACGPTAMHDCVFTSTTSCNSTARNGTGLKYKNIHRNPPSGGAFRGALFTAQKLRAVSTAVSCTGARKSKRERQGMEGPQTIDIDSEANGVGGGTKDGGNTHHLFRRGRAEVKKRYGIKFWKVNP